MGVEPSMLTLILNKKHSRHGLLFQSTISLHLNFMFDLIGLKMQHLKV